MAIFSLSKLKKPTPGRTSVKSKQELLRQLAQPIAARPAVPSAPISVSSAGKLPSTGVTVGGPAAGLTNPPTVDASGAIAFDPTIDRAGVPENIGDIRVGEQVLEKIPPQPIVGQPAKELPEVDTRTPEEKLRDAAAGAPDEDIRANRGIPEAVRSGIRSRQDLIDEAIRRMLEGVPGSEAARRAVEEETRVAEARGIQQARARTGLGGMALSGAAASLESDIGRRAARDRALALEEFDRQRRQEDIAQRAAGISASQAEERLGYERAAFGVETDIIEQELQRDINRDGTIAGKPAEEAQAEQQAQEQEKERQNRSALSQQLRSMPKLQASGGVSANLLTQAQLDQISSDFDLELTPITVSGVQDTAAGTLPGLSIDVVREDRAGYRDQYGNIYIVAD